jgi:hypothetical protein
MQSDQNPAKVLPERGLMTIFHDQSGALGAPAIHSPETQQTGRFLRALIRIRAGARA